MSWFKQAISKEAVGSSFAGAQAGSAFGPWGAAAGGVIGGLSGAFSPSSVGGITGQGGELGEEARKYYDQAFPGTNPWERLGSGNPMGQMGSAGLTAKAQQQNVRTQSNTALANTAKQTTTAKETTEITAGAHVKVGLATARASAAATAAHLNPEDQANLMRAVTDGPDAIGYRAPTSISSFRETAGAATLASKSGERQATVGETQVKINKQLQRLVSVKMDIETAHMAGDPATAALRAMAVKVFESGIRDNDEIAKQLIDQFPALLGLGTIGEIGTWISKVIGGAVGTKLRGGKGKRKIPKKTSVREGPMSHLIPKKATPRPRREPFIRQRGPTQR